jgi:hypothetical protein
MVTEYEVYGPPIPTKLLVPMMSSGYAALMSIRMPVIGD